MKRISLNFFIDAFGWEMFKENPFLGELLTHHYKLKSVYGYSSACVPAILFGSLPEEHGFWATFYYAPHSSPFSFLSWLSLLPTALTNRSRIRHHINKLVKKKLGIQGYFNLYRFPFKKLRYYDYNEKVNFYQPGSTLSPTIFDKLLAKNIPYYSFSVEKNEDIQWKELRQHINQGEIQFSYVSLGKIDALLHMNERTSPKIKDQLARYAAQIKELYDLACTHYDEVDLSVFSDHDMAPITGSIDLMAEIERLQLNYGVDYAAIYDSTMARFWFFNNDAEIKIRNKLSEIAGGRIMPLLELKYLGALFPVNKYGEAIFQLNEGLIINPSYMGEKVIAGMHGYHPDNKFSSAMCITNHEPLSAPVRITDLQPVMFRGL